MASSRSCSERDEVFPDLPQRAKWKTWERQWFYYTMPNCPALAYRGFVPVGNDNWSSSPRETKRMGLLVSAILRLREGGPMAWDVACDFSSRQRRPLAARYHPTWEVSGEELEAGKTSIKSLL